MNIEYQNETYYSINGIVGFFKNKFYDEYGDVMYDSVNRFFNDKLTSDQKLIVVSEYEYEVLKKMVYNYGDTRYLPNRVICSKDENLKCPDEFRDYISGMYISEWEFNKMLLENK